MFNFPGWFVLNLWDWRIISPQENLKMNALFTRKNKSVWMAIFLLSESHFIFVACLKLKKFTWKCLFQPRYIFGSVNVCFVQTCLKLSIFISLVYGNSWYGRSLLGYSLRSLSALSLSSLTSLVVQGREPKILRLVSTIPFLLLHNLGYFSQKHWSPPNTSLVLVERPTENAEIWGRPCFRLFLLHIFWQKCKKHWVG